MIPRWKFLARLQTPKSGDPTYFNDFCAKNQKIRTLTRNFIIIGKGENDTTLKKQVVRLGLERRVKFVGFKLELLPTFT